MTVGLGAAMASGAAIAHADDASKAGSGGVGHSQSADSGSTSSTKSTGASKQTAALTAASVGPKRATSALLNARTSTADPTNSGSDTAVSAAETAASTRDDAGVNTVQTNLTPKAEAHTARSIAGVSAPQAAADTSLAGSASVTQTVAQPAATPPANQGQWIPTDIVPGQAVKTALTDISEAQGALNSATWGTNNVLGGLASVVPQALLSAASFELSAWEGSNPVAQGFFQGTYGIAILHEFAGVTVAGTMLLPSMAQFSMNVANFLLPVVGLFGANVAPAQGEVNNAQKNGQVYAVVPVKMYNTTEPLVNVSLNGASSKPLLIDTGSSGLVLSSNQVNVTGLTPIGGGTGAYSGGIDYNYKTYLMTVDFGNGAVSEPTPVNVVTEAWISGEDPNNPNTNKDPANFDKFLTGTGADGILGIGANAYGPGPNPIPTASLPGELSDGVLLYQNFWPFGLGGFMVLGPNALPARATLSGTPITPLRVSINGGAKQDVMSLVDSGGVYGTMPEDIVTPNSGGYVPTGTDIAVYAPDGTLLYSYIADSGPYATTSVGDSSTNYMNTGYYAFRQGPVYIDYSGNGGYGYTVFDWA